jgi:hypothetical protein
VENPLLGVIAVFKEMAEAGVEAVKKLMEGVSELGHEFQHLGLEAAKAGVSTEFLENMQLAGRTVEVSGQEIANGLKFINERASEAAGGDSASAEVFQRMGISVDFLKSHLGDTEAITSKVMQSISGLGTAAEKTDAGMRLMGRAGAGMVPLLAMGTDGISKMGDEMGKLRGHVTEADATVGAGFQRITLAVGDAWEGIKRAVEEPILQYFSDHADELVPKIEAIATTIKDALGGAMTHVGPIIEGVLGLFDGASGLIGPFITELSEGLQRTWGFLHAVWDILEPIVELIVDVLVPIFKVIETILKPIFDLLITGLGAIGVGIQAVVHGTDSSQFKSAVDSTNASAARVGSDLGMDVKAEVKINSEDTAQRIAEKLKPHVDDAVAGHMNQLGSHSKGRKIAKAIGGRP